MQTRNKLLPKSTTREHANVRSSRMPKKTTVVSQSTELITSSVKKQKNVGLLSKQKGNTQQGRNLNSSNQLQDETHVACLDNGTSICRKQQSDDQATECMSETIFSSTFHHSKDISGAITEKAGFVELNRNAGSHHEPGDEQSEGIYLAMQNSKLECVDEQSQETMSTEVCVDPDDCDDFDDFDPYLFIKDLPDLLAVVPRFRPMLLPKQTRSCPLTTLVLDLDETLVHSTLEPCADADFKFPVNFNLKEHTIYVRCRPYLSDFLDTVSTMFETIIFTASQSIYAEQLLNVLDPKRRLLRHRVYRDSCVFVEGNYVKDLSVLGRDLARVIIVDNSPQAFGFQLDNGIPIESWFEDPNDRELLSLLPFLESLAGVDDVRPLIGKKFNLRGKLIGGEAENANIFLVVSPDATLSGKRFRRPRPELSLPLTRADALRQSVSIGALPSGEPQALEVLVSSIKNWEWMDPLGAESWRSSRRSSS